MSKNPGQSSQSQSMLATNLDQLKKLIKEETVTHDGEFLRSKDPCDVMEAMERESKQHATEISNLLLWIATHHPEVLKDQAEELRNVSVKRLYFLKSWEFPDELVPTNSLITLLTSSACKDIQTFCGYVTSQVVKKFPQKMIQIRLALGKHNDVGSIIEELNCRQKDLNPTEHVKLISVHFRCGQVDLRDLAPLPNVDCKVYISDVSDDDVAWVVKASTVLTPKDSDCMLEALHLPRSQLTKVGVEAIAKGLFDAGVSLDYFGVSTPNIGNNSEDSSDSEVSSDSELSFTEMISDKYNVDMMTLDDEEGLEFTTFTDYLPDDATAKDIARVLEEMSHDMHDSTDEWEDVSDHDEYPDEDFLRLLKVMKQQMGQSEEESSDDSDDDITSDDPDIVDIANIFVRVLNKVRDRVGGIQDKQDEDTDNDELPELLEMGDNQNVGSDDDLPNLVEDGNNRSEYQGRTEVLNLKGNLMSKPDPKPRFQIPTGPPAYKTSPNGPSEQQPKGKCPLASNGLSTPSEYPVGEVCYDVDDLPDLE